MVRRFRTPEKTLKRYNTKMEPQIQAILSFLQIAEKLKSTLRHNWTTTGRQESTAEHTWRLLLLFTVLQHYRQFSVDTTKVFKMLLIHDLPEVVHGDVPGFSKQASDKTLEQEAAKLVVASLSPELQIEFLSLLSEYDAQRTLESKLAKACDRIETLLQHLEAGKKYLKAEELGTHTSSYGKAQIENLNDPLVTKLYEEIQAKLVPLIKQREKELG